MKIKKLLGLVLAGAMTMTTLAGCGAQSTETETKEPAAEASQEEQTETEGATDTASLEGTTLNVFTHMGQLVLGEEKKDEDGNTYRDESTAYMRLLADEFTKETGINVEFHVFSGEDEVIKLLQVEDEGIDVHSALGWSIEQCIEYSEPYCTLEEGVELYGDYAYAMPNDGEYIYSILPARTYNNAVVYNEEVLKSVGYDQVPGTLEEFNEMCVKLRDAGKIPMAIHRIENWPLSTVKDFAAYVSGQNDVFDRMLESDAPFSPEEPMGKTIKMYTEWKANGFFEQEVFADFGAAMDSVAYGDAAMMLFGSWVVPQIQSRVPEGTDPSSIKMAPAPDFGSGSYVLAEPTDNWTISKYSPNKEAARLWVEYIADNAEYYEKIGYIANKKGVEPVVPEIYALIDGAVAAGTTEVMMRAPKTENTINNQNVLAEANLLADEKYVGLLYDSLDVTKPDSWEAYDEQVENQNQLYTEYREELGVSWVE